MSDTMLLKSPTTTAEDRQAAMELAEIAGVNWQAWGEKMLSRIAILEKLDPVAMVAADFKEYDEQKIHFGIGQIEVGSLNGLEHTKGALLQALENLREQKKLAWAMVLVTDVMEEHSVLLCTPFEEAERELIYEGVEQGIYDLPDVLSRKKQLLPEILRVIQVVQQG